MARRYLNGIGIRPPRHPPIACGDCFRWAAQFAKTFSDWSNVRVVHGLFGEQRTPHAWVEVRQPDGSVLVYDWQRLLDRLLR